jgi:hypothetical protein
MNNNVVSLGSQIVLNVCIEPIDGVTAKDYDFKVLVYCTPKRPVVNSKEELFTVDDNNYLMLVDTEDIGIGVITCKVEAMLPDGRFPNGVRREIKVINTGLNIVKA